MSGISLLVSADYCISSEVEPAALEIRIEVRLLMAVNTDIPPRSTGYASLFPEVVDKLGSGYNHTGERLWVRS